VDRYEGFREFLAVHGHALSRAAFFLTGDHAAAEDLLQEALTRTVTRWRTVAGGGKPESYVRRVMLNEPRSRWLGCSVETVKSQTHDALARLREFAPELLPGPGPLPGAVRVDEPTEVTE
jgi:DNA-directed RNA polymerase specialized sigma24 family protein